MSRKRWLWVLAVVVGGGALFAVWTTQKSRTIETYRVLTEHELSLSVAGVNCGTDVDVQVEESPTQVRILVNAPLWSVKSNDCEFLVRVPIEADLGDREVIDESNGLPVRRVRRP